jgi:glutamine synthetase
MAKYGSRLSGRLSRAELEELVHNGELETIVTVVPDLYGRLVGKRITGRFFLDETADHGMHMCDYLLACDMEMDPVQGYAFTSWEKGYGDVLCKVDWATLRKASWLEKSAIIVCDVFDEKSELPVSIAPRSLLRRQLQRARERGFVAQGASELEFFAFKEPSRAPGQAPRPATDGQYVEDYHILQGTKTEPLVGSIRRHLEASGVPVEFSKGEWGPGQQEINLRYCELLEMADRHVLYKNAAKEIAHSLGLAITFMAK